MAHSAAREDGYMLIELLIAMALMLAVGGAILTMLESGSRQEPRVTERSLRLDEARGAIDRLQRELRQAYAVVSTGSDSVDFLTYVRGGSGTAAQRRVAYSCGSGSCTRYETVPDPSASLPPTGKRVVSGVANSDIFGFVPDGISPTEVRLKLRLSIPGANTVTLADGAQLRNVR